MPKLARKCYATYLDSTFKVGADSAPAWFLIGKDIEDMSVELNPNIDTKENILGETAVTDNGFEPQVTADPYYANPTDTIYPKLKSIAMERLKGDDCKTHILEVIIEDASATKHEAYMEDVVVKPTSYGGDTAGFAIPFDIHFDGNRKKGTVTITAGVPTFTEGAGE